MKQAITLTLLATMVVGCSSTYECNVYDTDENTLIYTAEYEAASADEAEDICVDDGGGYGWLSCSCD